MTYNGADRPGMQLRYFALGNLSRKCALHGVRIPSALATLLRDLLFEIRSSVVVVESLLRQNMSFQFLIYSSAFNCGLRVRISHNTHTV